MVTRHRAKGSLREVNQSHAKISNKATRDTADMINHHPIIHANVVMLSLRFHDLVAGSLTLLDRQGACCSKRRTIEARR